MQTSQVSPLPDIVSPCNEVDIGHTSTGNESNHGSDFLGLEDYIDSSIQTCSSFIVSATLHQGDVVFSKQSRGRQCVANALCSILHATIGPPVRWQPEDIDKILNMGDTLYTSIRNKRNNYLLPGEIPSNFETVEGSATVAITDSVYGVIGSHHIPDLDSGTVSLLHALGQRLQSQHYGIVTLGEYSSSVIRSEGNLYLFDSHSRDHSGFPVSDGHAVQFASTQNLFHYINELCEKLQVTQFNLNGVEASLEMTPSDESQTVRSNSNSTGTTHQIRVADIAPLPVRSPIGLRKRRKQQACILTDSPFRNEKVKQWDKNTNSIITEDV